MNQEKSEVELELNQLHTTMMEKKSRNENGTKRNNVENGDHKYESVNSDEKNNDLEARPKSNHVS